MARKTTFYVQTFEKKGNRLIQAALREFKSADDAKQKGAYAAERHVGVLVYSIDADKDANDWDDPVMIANYGEVPEEAMAA